MSVQKEDVVGKGARVLGKAIGASWQQYIAKMARRSTSSKTVKVFGSPKLTLAAECSKSLGTMRIQKLIRKKRTTY